MYIPRTQEQKEGELVIEYSGVACILATSIMPNVVDWFERVYINNMESPFVKVVPESMNITELFHGFQEKEF